MPDSQSYQLMYTGEQVDDALGRIISGEINQSAQNSAISSYASRVWAEGEQASYNPVSFGQIEAHGVKVAYDGTEDISIVPGATYKVTSGSDEVSVIAAVNPSATEYGTFTAFGIVFDSNAANYINATNSTDTTITVSTQRQPSGFSGTSSKQYAQQAGQRANSAAQSNTNAGNAAQQAESWAVGGTGTRDGEDTNNAKYWCEQAQEAGQGVSSFNNRTGAVVPQSGDYSADMIADLPIHNVVGTEEDPIDLLAARPNGVYLFSGEFVDRSEEFDAAFPMFLGVWESIKTNITMFFTYVGTTQGFTYYLNFSNSSTTILWATDGTQILEANYTRPETFASMKPSLDNFYNEKINSTEATLTVSGWSGETAPYTQTVTAYVSPYENGLITMAKNATDEQYLAAAKAKIRVDSQPGSGNLTLKATGEKPNIDIPVVVVGWNNISAGSSSSSYYVMDGLPQDIGGGEAGVTSFAGRTGAVTPQSGDYTAAMVGALSTSGGTMTGAITMPESGAALTDGSLEVGKDSSGNLVIGLPSPLTGDVNGLTISQSGNVSLSSLQDPTNNTDAANKRYVDNTAASILPSGGTDGQILTKTASGVAWQDAPASGGKRICRYVVGTSSAGWTAAECDYLCDGTDDQVEINAALAALPAGGGEVRLLDGTYHLSGAITAANGAVKLSGCGKSTILEPQLTSEAPHAFELSCPSFRLEQAAVHLTYVGAVSILLSAEVALFQGTSAVEEISLAGCEIDNLILYYVKAPATAKFTMEECSSLATSPPTTAQPASLCMCEYRDCFFAHRIFLHQADSAVVNCSFDVPSTMTEPVILLYASALILGNRLRAVNAIEGSTGGRSTVTGNRITLRDGGSLLKPRIGITCYSGDLVQGNTVLREEGAAAFRATEYTIQVSEYATAAAVLGNILADKDVSDNGTSTVTANNVVLTTV